jgi:hypothetical protein
MKRDTTTIKAAIKNLIARNEATIKEAEKGKEGLQSEYAYKYGMIKSRLDWSNKDLEIVLELLEELK